MLVDIASYNVLDEIWLLVEFIFRGGKMCKFMHLMRQTIQFECIPVEVVVPFIGSG